MVDLRDEKLLANIERLLNPQPILNPHIFADNGLMREDVRQQILKQVDNFLSQNIKQLPGIDWEDAFLGGSSASYFWKEDSDFDICIKPKVNYKKFFIKEEAAAQLYLEKHVKANKRKKHIHPYANNRQLDIKVGIEHLREMCGAYSIVNNCWIVKPQKNGMALPTKEQIYETVLIRKDEILQVIKDFSYRDISQISFEDLKKLTDFYDEILKKPYKNEFEYIIIKLLRYDGITFKLRDFCAEAIAKVLSIPLPTEQKD